MATQNWPTAMSLSGGKPENNLPDNSPLHRAAKQWPSPRSEDSESAGNHPNATDSLTGVTGMWVTPHGMGNVDHAGKVGTGNGESLLMAQWQTPASDSFRSRGGERKDEHGLDQQARMAEHWMTPSANEDAAGTVDGNMQQMLTHQAKRFHPAPETPPPGQPSSESAPTSPRRSLNPKFVEWLMNWPPGWTSLAPLA